MNLSYRTATIAALVSLACLAPACSSLLGLGDFKDAPADAGSTGGSAGVGGGAGAAGSAGTAGTGGAAGKDGGSDASDGGTFDCTPLGNAFSVLSAADLGNATINRLLMVDGPAVSAATKPRMFAIADAGPAGLFVRSLTDDPNAPAGNLLTYSPSPSFGVGFAYADKTALYLLGQQGSDLVELSFPLDSGGDPQTPPVPTTIAAKPCSQGVESLCFMHDGSSVIHTAVTCNEQNAEAGSTLALYLDGTFVGSAPNSKDDFIIRGCTEIGSTLVVQTGADFGPTALRYGKVADDLKTAHPISFTSDQNRGTVIGAPIADPGHGLMLMGITLAGPPNYTPIRVFAGVIPVASFADLDKAPVPGLSQGPTLSDINQLNSFQSADVGQSIVQFAGTDLTGAKVGLTVVSSAGKVLVFGAPVHTADLQTSKVVAAAVGSVSVSSFVVWQEQSAEGGAKQYVLGRPMLCSGGA